MNYNKYIDHTLLKPEATKQQIEKLCTEAKQYDFASVCVNPDYVSLCKELLKGTDVKVCTVIGFPLGSNTTETKVFETRDAIHNGATEIDMVINIS
jgi:deoxyribose-phosphate aldolase